LARRKGRKKDGGRSGNDATARKTCPGTEPLTTNQVSPLRAMLSYLITYKFLGFAIGIAGLIVGIVSYCAYLKDKTAQSTSGKLQSSKPAEKRIIAIGSARLIVDSTDDILLREDQESLITVRMIDSKIYVSTVIRNSDGEIVAQLRDNEWQLNRKNYFDRNFNEQALEVVDHSGKAVLQVVNFGDVIHLACVFHRKDGSPFALIPFGKYGALMGNGPPFVALSSAYMYENSDEKFPHLNGDPEIPLIFDYPSELHLGSSPGLKPLTGLVRMSENSTKYKGYRLGSSLDIGLKHLRK
jgi:hypothetical protein